MKTIQPLSDNPEANPPDQPASIITPVTMPESPAPLESAAPPQPPAPPAPEALPPAIPMPTPPVPYPAPVPPAPLPSAPLPPTLTPPPVPVAPAVPPLPVPSAQPVPAAAPAGIAPAQTPAPTTAFITGSSLAFQDLEASHAKQKKYLLMGLIAVVVIAVIGLAGFLFVKMNHLPTMSYTNSKQEKVSFKYFKGSEVVSASDIYFASMASASIKSDTKFVRSPDFSGTKTSLAFAVESVNSSTSSSQLAATKEASCKSGKYTVEVPKMHTTADVCTIELEGKKFMNFVWFESGGKQYFGMMLFDVDGKAVDKMSESEQNAVLKQMDLTLYDKDIKTIIGSISIKK